jgi:hypothetical protein
MKMKKKTLIICIKLIMIAYSLYVLLLSIGVYLNGAVCLTYHAASDHDIKYVIFYAKIIVIYGIISLILYCISLFKQKKLSSNNKDERDNTE